MNISLSIYGFITIEQLKEITTITENYKNNGLNSNIRSVKVWINAYLYEESFNLQHSIYNIAIDYIKDKNNINEMSIKVSVK